MGLVTLLERAHVKPTGVGFGDPTAPFQSALVDGCYTKGRTNGKDHRYSPVSEIDNDHSQPESQTLASATEPRLTKTADDGRESADDLPRQGSMETPVILVMTPAHFGEHPSPCLGRNRTRQDLPYTEGFGGLSCASLFRPAVTLLEAP